jgi:hypothetical protein
MIALFLAALFSHSEPATTVSPVPAALSSVTPLASSVPAARPSDVVIVNSGSTNTLGYRLDVHSDATVDVTQAGETVRKSVTRAQLADLMDAVKAAGPLGALPSGRCMRSASFGSFTRVTYAGETSSDIGCGAGPAGRTLSGAVNAIVANLELRQFRSPSMPLRGPGLMPHSATSPGP